MWHEILQDFKKNNKQFLDFKFDLHVTIYIISILKDTIKFTITKNKTKESLTITYYDEEKQKKLSNDAFFYWWQIDRHDELLSEEEIIFTEFNDLKNKIMKAQEKIKNPEINEDDSEEEKQTKQQQIDENNQTSQKLNIHLKKEADKSNEQINELRRFRTLYTTTESLDKLLKNIMIILKNKK